MQSPSIPSSYSTLSFAYFALVVLLSLVNSSYTAAKNRIFKYTLFLKMLGRTSYIYFLINWMLRPWKSLPEQLSLTAPYIHIMHYISSMYISLIYENVGRSPSPSLMSSMITARLLVWLRATCVRRSTASSWLALAEEEKLPSHTDCLLPI